MSNDHRRRSDLVPTLLLALVLAWPAVPVTSTTAMAMADEAAACEQCCFRCDDGNTPLLLPCSGAAPGCSGLLAVSAGVDVPTPLFISGYRDRTTATFVSWAPDPDHRPPKPAADS